MDNQPVRLHFQASGEGLPVVILHGLFGSGSNWKRHARHFDRRYRVLLPDLRNHGRSPHAPSMDYHALAEDLRCLLDEQALDKVALVGHSMGGKAAMTLALTRPERVAALVVVDVAPVAYGGHLYEYVDAMREVELADIDSRAQADKALAGAIADPMVRQFLLTNLEARASGYQWRIPLNILADQMPCIEGFPELTTTFPNPTLFIHGENSTYVPDSARRLIQERFPQAALACIPEAGHWLHVEAPQQFAELLEGFLGRSYART